LILRPNSLCAFAPLRAKLEEYGMLTLIKPPPKVGNAVNTFLFVFFVAFVVKNSFRHLPFLGDRA
jgi:hypothetical protein